MIPQSRLPTLEERQRWWILAYAKSSLMQCLDRCNQMLAIVKSTQDDLYLPFAIAIHALYCRPFYKQRGVGKLEESFVPDRSRDLHKAMLTFRDKVFCHTDSSHAEECGRPLNDLVCAVYEHHIEFQTVTLAPRMDVFQNLASETLPALIQKLADHLGEKEKTFSSLIPLKDGDYLFQVTGEDLFPQYVELPSTIIFAAGSSEKK